MCMVERNAPPPSGHSEYANQQMQCSVIKSLTVSPAGVEVRRASPMAFTVPVHTETDGGSLSFQ